MIPKNIVCVVCNITKSAEDFYKRQKETVACRKICKVCQKKMAIDRYWKNPEAARKIKRDDRKKNPVRYMLISARQRARRTNVPFSITESDITIPENCPCFGIPLVQNKGKTCPGSATLDQIVAGKGYVSGNIQVISLKANTMKSNATRTELELFSKWITSTRSAEEEDNDEPVDTDE